jgi:phosphomannomutase
VRLDAGIPRASWDRLGEVVIDAEAVDRHIAHVLALPFLDVDAIRARSFRVALDCCHGAGAVIMPRLLQQLGCEVFAIGMTPDGRFPRPPEPIAEQLGELEALVRNTTAHVGFATDPDVDRLALVLDDGVAPGEDYTLAFAARTVLRHRRGPVVTNLSTSRIVSDVAADAGVPFHFASVGEVHVAIAMRDHGATIGGEGNGGVILPELHLGRDAPVGAALLLQLMCEEAQPLSQLKASRPQYVIVKDKLDRPSGDLGAVYEALRDAFPDASADRQDGLRLDWSDRWVHLRPSGTEPIVRVIAEAPTRDEARELIQQAREPLAALAAA